METPETIMQWNKDTFPETTLSEQMEKFWLEEDETNNAKSNKKRLSELADMVITAYGLARFENYLPFFITAIIEIDRWIGLIEIDIPNFYKKLQKAIDKKMAINRKRQWHKVNGEYRHI